MIERMIRINRFLEELKEEKLTKKYLYSGDWISGSSTIVFPITIWKNSIVLQWKSDKKIFDKFINRLVMRNTDLFDNGVFWKSDGSCPSTIILYFTDKYKN